MTLKIEGMMCKHCQARVEKALKAVAGVESVEVDLEAKTAEVTGSASAEALKQAVTDAGYQVVGQARHTGAPARNNARVLDFTFHIH